MLPSVSQSILGQVTEALPIVNTSHASQWVNLRQTHFGLMQPFTIQRFYYAPVIAGTFNAVKMMMESSYKTTFLSHKDGLDFSLKVSSNRTEEVLLVMEPTFSWRLSQPCSSPFKVHQSQQSMKRNLFRLEASHISQLKLHLTGV